MIYQSFIDRGTSPQGVSHSVERVLELRVLGEDARVIGILLIVIIRVRAGVGGGGIVIIAGAKVNAKSDADGYNGGYSETRREELGTVQNGLVERFGTVSDYIIQRSTFNVRVPRRLQQASDKPSRTHGTHRTQDTQGDTQGDTGRLTRIRVHFRFRGLLGASGSGSGSGSVEPMSRPPGACKPGVLENALAEEFNAALF